MKNLALKKFFLSLIIISTLATDGGAYLSADLVNLYVYNILPQDKALNSRTTLAINSNAVKSGLTITRVNSLPGYSYQSRDNYNQEINDPQYKNTVGLPIAKPSLLIFFIVTLLCLYSIMITTSNRYICSYANSSPPVLGYSTNLQN